MDWDLTHIQTVCGFAGWLRINNEWVNLPTQALKSHWTIPVSSQTHTSGRFDKVLKLCHLPLELICTLASVLLICTCFKSRRAGITRQPVQTLCNLLSMSDLKKNVPASPVGYSGFQYPHGHVASNTSARMNL